MVIDVNELYPYPDAKEQKTAVDNTGGYAYNNNI